MRVYFSTVIRSAPTLEGGEIVRLQWESKRIEARATVAATNPILDDPNPRGNTRGGRGIARRGDEILVCSYHTVKAFDPELRPVRDLSHPLMVGLHEVHATARDSLLVTCTATDAVLEIDLESGDCRRAWWPREQPGLQAALEVVPLAIDKQADNRGRFLAGDHLSDGGHLHLNAVAEHAGEVYALFNRFGVIANLDRDTVVVRDRGIRRGHNLRIDAAGHALANDTAGRHVYGFDLEKGERTRDVDLMEFAPVAALARWRDRGRRLKQRLHRRGWLSDAPPKPIFVRGLARYGEWLFVGISPATILQIEESTGRLVDHFTFSRRVQDCIHGLHIEDD